MTLFIPLLFASIISVTSVISPSVILVVTDDMRYDDLAYMPHTLELIGDAGATFSNTFVTQPLCCPSRASILRGQYSHNTGIQANGGADGGFNKFKAWGLENSTIATWLDSAGYNTVLIGKYLNQYDAETPVYVPPGWDEWHGLCPENDYNNFAVCTHNGVITYTDTYQTDVLSGTAVSFIQQAMPPFFLYLAPFAPHSQDGLGAVPAPRHADLFPGLQAPRPDSFNEADVSDKPAWIKNQLGLLTEVQIADIDNKYRLKIQTLQAVDEMVASVIAALETTGQLTNTYIIFMSDNGLQQGEHRLKGGKDRPYEESIRIPLLMRGPGITASTVITQLVLNTDLAPSIAEWAGVTPTYTVDGRSLVPLLNGTATTWRNGFLIESDPPSDPDPQDFHAIRTACKIYVEYVVRRERYDLAADPFELSSLTGDNGLSSYLHDLQVCEGDECRIVENSIPTCN